MAKKSYKGMGTLLKAYIDQNGKESLERDAYPVYEMLKREGAEPRQAGAVLLTLLAGIPGEADRQGEKAQGLKEMIQQTCFFEEKTAAALEKMYEALYSKENRAAWEKETEAGFAEFCTTSWNYSWEDRGRWYPEDNHHVYVTYGYSMSCVLEVEEQYKVREYFSLELGKNPFIDADALFQSLADDLDRQIGSAFAETVEELDTYYPPTGDEFGYRDLFEDFCRENGFRLQDFEEFGEDGGGYEHD